MIDAFLLVGIGLINFFLFFFLGAFLGARKGYRYAYQELRLKKQLEKSALSRPLTDQEKKFMASFADKNL